MNQVAEQGPLNQVDQRRCWQILVALLAILLYAYANTLWAVATTWNSPQYSHGWMIPLFAAFLIWIRRQEFVRVQPRDRWVGVGFIVFGTIVRVAGAHYVWFTLDNLSLIPCLLGIFLLVGGFPSLKWAAPGILFLVFMYPLPGVMVDRMLRPLQGLATMSSVYALQTLGVEVYRDGNRILLDQVEMGVVDQCSGLRMLTIFIALSVALALMSDYRPIWERVGIVFSSVPIALLVNCIRITVTGLLYNLNVNEEVAKTVFHDLAGWIMMPMAFGFLWLVSKILASLVIEEDIQPGSTPAGVAVGSLRGA